MPSTGLIPALRGRLVQLERAVHVPVVGDADRGLPVGGGRGHDLADPRRTVEHRVLGVEVQMDEGVGIRNLGTSDAVHDFDWLT